MRHSLWYARGFYFFFYAAAATLIPFLPLYYAALGLTAPQIGLVTGLTPLVTLVGAALWGGLADATRRHHQWLIVACVGSWLAAFALARVKPLTPLLLTAMLYAFFIAPIIPLVDNSVLALLGDRKEAYGRQRLWGSVGWSLSAAVAGVLIQRHGLPLAFSLYLVLFLGVLPVAWKLAVPAVALGGAFSRQVRSLMADRRWWLFLSVALVQGLTLSVYGNYLFLYLETLQVSRGLMGLSLTLATLSEVPIFLLVGRWQRRLPPLFLLGVSLLLMAVRSFAYVAIAEAWWVLAVSLLHGPTFSLMWSAAVAYAGELAPPGLGATAQGVLTGTTFGLGGALGALGGGLIYGWVGPVAVFCWAGGLCLMMVVVFGLVERRRFIKVA